MTRLALLLTLLAAPAFADIQVAFSPGNAEQTVMQAIGEAHRSIHLAAYGFTSEPVAQALLAAHARGVEIDAVLDKSNGRGRSDATELTAAGIPIRIDRRYAIMHDKFMVIDGATVETGSFNFTASAAHRNAENVLVLRDMPDVAGQYETEWDRLWNESEGM